MISNLDLRIQTLEMSNIGGFKKFDVTFSPSFNLICGANGVGKTTILSVIARAFSFHQSNLFRRRAAATIPGKWTIKVRDRHNDLTSSGEAAGLLPQEHDSLINHATQQQSRFLLHFKANRDFVYSRLEGIGRDPNTDQSYWSASAIEGVGQHDLKRWLANRYLFSAHPGSLTSQQDADLEFAKECFSILDRTVKFERIDAASFDTYVTTDHGAVPFEYLSSGFRASLAMLLGIIREIEVRQFDVPANKFSGVILIDELDLHLHPTWQRSIIRALKTAFPNAQFIVTTHSPHMIQAADQGEVIPLVRDESGNPTIGRFKTGFYGFKGWTIEEILRDVMGLESTDSEPFSNAMKEFDQAIELNDESRLQAVLCELDSMLNPSNHLRKILRVQAAPFGGRIHD